MAHEVFISYSSKDQATADLVCEALEARGIRCWIASRDIVPGSVWLSSIVEAIDSCRVLVLLFSAHANRSVQVLRELERAVHRGVALLPFRTEPVAPSGRMEHLINVVQWLQAYPLPVEQYLAPLILAVQWLLKEAPGAADDEAGLESPTSD